MMIKILSWQKGAASLVMKIMPFTITLTTKRMNISQWSTPCHASEQVEMQQDAAGCSRMQQDAAGCSRMQQDAARADWTTCYFLSRRLSPASGSRYFRR